ncbi:PHP domain-containing protein [Candidatus Woesearchaeota archaeon]|nr:PHP domain-containing protein [Candidatus Woesearchaeota archaeon]
MKLKPNFSNVRNASTSGEIMINYSERIKFKKPVFSEIKNFNIFDMHFHTVYSDGASKIKDIVKITKKTDIGVAITDHNKIKGSLKAEASGAKVIPGIEIKLKNGIDILCYFYDSAELKEFYTKEIKNKLKGIFYTRLDFEYDEFLDICEKYNCLLSFAHPGKYDLLKYKEIVNSIEVLEVINSGISRKKNMEAFNRIRKQKKSFTAGSDGHSIYEFGNAVVYSDSSDTQEFLEKIEKRKNYAVGKELRFGMKQRLFYNIKNRFSTILK